MRGAGLEAVGHQRISLSARFFTTRSAWWISHALTLAAVCAATGCYKYALAPVESVTPPEIVRVHLTPQGMMRVDSLFTAEPWISVGSLLGGGPARIPAMVENRLEGRLVSNGGAELGMSLEYPNASSRLVRIPLSQIGRLDRKRIDPLRTALLVGGGLGASAIALISLDLAGKPGAGQEGPRNEPSPLRIPFPLVP
jgi:hypothetical protein